MSTDDAIATRTRSTFRFRCSVVTEIQSPPEKVWALLTRTDGMVSWNSTLTSIEGEIERVAR